LEASDEEVEEPPVQAAAPTTSAIPKAKNIRKAKVRKPLTTMHLAAWCRFYRVRFTHIQVCIGGLQTSGSKLKNVCKVSAKLAGLAGAPALLP